MPEEPKPSGATIREGCVISTLSVGSKPSRAERTTNPRINSWGKDAVMDMQAAIRRVSERRDLSASEMSTIMNTIMTGGATAAQIGGFLVGLRMKGETVEEVAAAASVMRNLATSVEVSPDYLVDTCGTGGDQSDTFNISTTSALVAAGAGARVAKHGNRSVSSRSGSADVLEAAGVQLDLTPTQLARCIDEAHVGFMFAPSHHAAMRYAVGPRREMGLRTLFNLLGPLANPARAPNQVVGVRVEEEGSGVGRRAIAQGFDSSLTDFDSAMLS